MADGNPVVILRLPGDVPLSALYRGKLVKLLKPGHTLRANSDGSGLEDDAYLPPFSDAAIADGQVYAYDDASGLLVPATITGGVSMLHSSDDDSTAISNTTTETAFDNSTFTLAAETLAVGDVLTMECYGRMAGFSMASSALTVRINAGATNLKTLGILNVPGPGNRYFQFVAKINVRSIGASGSLATVPLHAEYATAPVSKTNRTIATVDTESDIDFEVTAQWSSASASNSVDLNYVAWTLAKRAA